MILAYILLYFLVGFIIGGLIVRYFLFCKASKS